jgi:arsenite-transporting ATPase
LIYRFFIGKGGVGKSTLAALSALYFARKKLRTMLISMDPAHNLSDIFQTGHSSKPVSILSSLYLVEIDIPEWTRKYLDGIQKQMQQSYRYLTAVNLEHHFDVIRHSPSLEEYALLQAFQHYLREEGLYDVMILDMPPTALTLRFFNLPRLSLIWLNELSSLRRHILKRKETILRVKEGSSDSEPDKIQGNLERQAQNYREILKVLCNPDKAGSMLVVNPDELSISEARRISEELRGLNIPMSYTLINKSVDSAKVPAIKPAIACRMIPFSHTPLVGMENLNRFLDKNMDIFNSFLQI